jgi:protein-ribulosamine 3-kinase
VVPDIQEWLLANDLGEIVRTEALGGGCIHQSQIIQTASGKRYFLKQNQSVPPDMFQKEAQGLEVLRNPNGPVLPEVFLVGESFLLLEDLQPASPCIDFWRIYGRQMAAVHLVVNDKFGFQTDNYIGSNPQRNSWNDDGFDFFRKCRIIPQLIMSEQGSLLKPEDVRKIEELLDKLPDLLPEQPASLLHGDLWSGNLITDSRGRPALIDPAVYYGWGEADLAMADLFGSYPEEFYQSYQEIRPLNKGYESRFPLYNLYHLLNHLNLFGRSYLPQIRAILARFVGP